MAPPDRPHELSRELSTAPTPATLPAWSKSARALSDWLESHAATLLGRSETEELVEVVAAVAKGVGGIKDDARERAARAAVCLLYTSPSPRD